jgi:hypothetical protein
VLLGVIPFSVSCSRDKDAVEHSSAGSSDCSRLKPNNPYEEGSGHYAGFKWGEEGKSCGGNSTSFIEGCHAFEAQQAAYVACLKRK